MLHCDLPENAEIVMRREFFWVSSIVLWCWLAYDHLAPKIVHIVMEHDIMR